METRVAVIGGGYAGIAAAFSLSESGIPVTLFESSKTLGGRARGIDCNGTRIDNGQHILLGCYRETLRLIEKTCRLPEPFFRMPLELAVDSFRLRSFPLPPPFDLLFGLLVSKGISLSEKLGAIGFMAKARSLELQADISVEKLLECHEQDSRITNFLWKPLCIAALNTPIETASARVFLAVLKDGLNGEGSDILIPRVDLSSLFPAGAAEIIRKNGGEILISSPVRSIRKSADGFEVSTDSAGRHFSHVILAVAPQHIGRLAKDLREIELPDFSYQPICTIYSQYPETIYLPHKMTGFSHGLAQWLIDRGEGLIAAVISSEGKHLALSQSELASKIHEEIRGVVPGLPPPFWQKVITEKRATFSCTVDVDRPEQKTALPGLYLAGDYTAGKYPATLEAAVLSGIKCADQIRLSL